MKKVNYLIKKAFRGILTLFLLSFVFESCGNDIEKPIEKQNVKANNEFITLWKTDDDKNIIIPTNSNYHYDYNISWVKEDNPEVKGEKLNITSVSDYTLSLPELGKYLVKISGNFPAIYFGKEKENINRENILSVKQWGDIKWESLRNAFYNCTNLQVTAKDKPNLSKVKDMSYMFCNTSLNKSINDWDVSNVTNMEGIFMNASSFNQPIDNWDVSNVTNMKDMFYGATNFNQPIGKWNVGKVTNMRRMFRDATNFNQPIGGWNVRRVTDMEDMFKAASNFNQPINNWNVSNVNNMSGMFYNTSLFNQPLNNWNIGKVVNMEWMFSHTKKFNQPLNNWKVNNVISMHNMFTHAEVFNQNLNNWRIQKNAIKCMFHSAPNFIEALVILRYWEDNGIIDEYTYWDLRDNCSEYQKHN